MAMDCSSDNEENVDMNQSRNSPSISSDLDRSCNMTARKIESTTEITEFEVKEDSAIDISTEPTTISKEVAKKKYENSPKEEKLDENATDVIHILTDDRSDNDKNVDWNQPRDTMPINFDLDTLCGDRVLRFEMPTAFTEVEEDEINNSTKSSTVSLEVTQKEYEKSPEKDKFDENATDITHMSAHDSSDNEKNVDMNNLRNPTPISSDVDKFCNMTCRKIEKTANFTCSKVEEDIAKNSSTEPTTVTLESERGGEM